MLVIRSVIQTNSSSYSSGTMWISSYFRSCRRTAAEVLAMDTISFRTDPCTSHTPPDVAAFLIVASPLARARGEDHTG
jgi:hypothetical protein